MTVKSSGVLSLTNDIVAEFGGSTPHSLSEYYGGGAYVNSEANPGVATSGPLNMGSYYGTTRALFVTATGGTITTDGDYKVHTFTGSGTFTVTSSGNSAGSNSVDYLIVAGGAPGGCYSGGAGGGAGGFRTSYGLQGQGCAAASSVTVSTSSYPIVIGAGGIFGSSYCPHPAFWYPGGDSSALGITSTGGGGGGGEVWAGREHGGDGGSGGGAYGTGGSGATCQGGDGQGGNWNGGGGGAGGDASGTTGGPGRASTISGASVTYAKGGDGSGSVAGGANTGNGGSATMANGGSGIVIIRYKFQ